VTSADPVGTTALGGYTTGERRSTGRVSRR